MPFKFVQSISIFMGKCSLYGHIFFSKVTITAKFPQETKPNLCFSICCRYIPGICNKLFSFEKYKLFLIMMGNDFLTLRDSNSQVI